MKTVTYYRALCWRIWGREVLYVAQKPGEHGVDWGWDRADKAQPLTRYWQQRFLRDQERCGVKLYEFGTVRVDS